MTCFEAITNAIKPETRHNITQSLYPRWKNIISPPKTTLLTATPSTNPPPTTTPSTTASTATALSTITPPTTTLAATAPSTTTCTARTALTATPSDHASTPRKKRRKLRKCKADLPIVIKPLVLKNLSTWASSPQEFFDQKSIEAKKECLWTYILTLSGLDVLNSIRLRYVKWKLYTHWIKWKGDSGKAKTFLQLLEDRGIILDLTDFKTWMLEGFTYDVFVQKWKEGSLIGTDLTATESVFLEKCVIHIANDGC